MTVPPTPADVSLSGPTPVWPVGAILLLACLASVILVCGLGSVAYPWPTVFAALRDLLPGRSPGADQTATAIIAHIRLSRALLALVVGAALSMSGTVFQAILRNPLADPFTIGVSTGAAFGASLALFFGLPAFGLGVLGLPAAALAGGVAALILVLLLGRVHGVLRRETLVLAGIVTATFLSACVALLKSLDESAVSAIVFWIMGSLQGRGFTHLWSMLPYFALGTALIAPRARELDLLALGETQARMLGLDAGRSRTLLLLGASILAAGAVAVSGVIGFVGLVVPHLVRLCVGASNGRILMVSAPLGALLLLWSDTLARMALPSGAELPVGVVTALCGGPFFALLLWRAKSGDGFA